MVFGLNTGSTVFSMTPQPALTYQDQGSCAGLPVLAAIPGQVMLLHLARDITGAGVKVLTPVNEPQPNQPEWPGLAMKAVLAHSANPEHWRVFVKVAGVWWCVDSTRANITLENPFTNQVNPAINGNVYTVDVLFFS